MYGEPVANHIHATERDRKVRNQQLKIKWQNRSKKIDDIGILCGNKLCEHCEQKASSLLSLCIGTVGHKILKSICQHFFIEKETMKKTLARDGGFFDEN